MKENCAIVAAPVELLHAAKSTMKTAGQVPWQHQPEGLQDPVSTDIDVALVKRANWQKRGNTCLQNSANNRRVEGQSRSERRGSNIDLATHEKAPRDGSNG